MKDTTINSSVRQVQAAVTAHSSASALCLAYLRADTTAMARHVLARLVPGRASRGAAHPGGQLQGCSGWPIKATWTTCACLPSACFAGSARAGEPPALGAVRVGQGGQQGRRPSRRSAARVQRLAHHEDACFVRGAAFFSLLYLCGCISLRVLPSQQHARGKRLVKWRLRAQRALRGVFRNRLHERATGFGR